MCLDLELDRTSPERSYTSGSNISGDVVFHNRKSQRVQQVVVYLEGTLKMLIKQQQSGAIRRKKHLLFTRHKTLFHDAPEQKRSDTTTTTQEPQRYRFDIQIPLVVSASPGPRTTSMNSEEVTLPPSLLVASATMDIEIEYKLTAILTRYTRLNRELTTRKKIEIQPLQPPNPFDNERDDMTTWSPVKPVSLPGIGSSLTALASTSLVLEVKSRTDQVLKPGRALSMQISIRVPREQQSTLLPLWLTNLSFRLLVRTTAMIESSSATDDVAYFTLWSYNGFLPLTLSPDSDYFRVPNSLWKDSIIPSLTPSFDCCGVSRSYQLQVLANLSQASRSSSWNYVVGTDIPVQCEVSAQLESPPSYAP